ncbi:MAG: hypothetical protein IRZ16_22385 [Myxococcaceae bacterium]|nr:hypothetical protein [Myxococcaceae bacterium]
MALLLRTPRRLRRRQAQERAREQQRRAEEARKKAEQQHKAQKQLELPPGLSDAEKSRQVQQFIARLAA